MKKTLSFAVCILLLTFGCARMGAMKPAQSTAPRTPARLIKTVYLWDVDGHTDMKLLRGLKAGAAKYLKERGFIVSDNPESTDAYVKITVIDASRDEEARKAYVRARVYVLDALDNSTIYDRTAEAKASGGDEECPDYPVERFIRDALSDFQKS